MCVRGVCDVCVCVSGCVHVCRCVLIMMSTMRVAKVLYKRGRGRKPSVRQVLKVEYPLGTPLYRTPLHRTPHSCRIHSFNASGFSIFSLFFLFFVSLSSA